MSRLGLGFGVVRFCKHTSIENAYLSKMFSTYGLTVFGVVVWFGVFFGFGGLGWVACPGGQIERTKA